MNCMGTLHLLPIGHGECILVVLESEVQHWVCKGTADDEASDQGDSNQLGCIPDRCLGLVLICKSLSLQVVLRSFLIGVNCTSNSSEV
eukprot:CAMPEP_0202919584 /NCGR_PEP_ID=MMETSP1392-20130828/76188_1 /ASSEMBLY_ACC=CAM_ASM_000868 /TAXON_ID=225041 /ORGANISM="Chlamydomonas chlamydogama, Strain SAG 11-48b" /LENGTH=87 /DNA_ID=CAMNT_0049613003 /DNA_START=12 /DNA_END=275 /DNA_ORIENTATION=-